MTKTAWPLALAAALCAAVYLPGLGSPLLWDDRSVIEGNAVLETVPLSSFFSRRYFEFAGEESWRPMATFSYALLVRLLGKSAAALRGLHLLLHAANAGLLARLAIALGLGAEAAAWGAALFLVHAAHTETLKCVAFNEEILVTLGLLSMLFFHRQGRRLWAALAFGFALLSKETGVVGLALAVLIDVLQEGWAFRRWRDYAIYGLVLAPYLYLRFGPLHAATAGAAPFALPAATRVYFGLASLAEAVKVLALPTALRLEYFALPPSSTGDWVLRAGTGLAALAAYAALLWRARGERGVLFFLLWPLPFLALTNPLWPVTVFNTRLFAERWLYLPALGAAVALGSWVCRRPRLGTVLLVLWGACGAARAADWSSETRLWTSLLDIYPWCAKAEEGLGEARFRQKDYAGALEAFSRARRLRERQEDLVLRAYAPLSQGNFVRWESPSLYRWLGHAEAVLGDLPGADDDFSRAQKLDPADGFTYRIMSYSWAQAGDFSKAGRWIALGLQAHPDDPFLLRLKADAGRGRLSFHAEFL